MQNNIHRKSHKRQFEEKSDLYNLNIDFILVKTNRLVFLVNPPGNWACIEDSTGLPITEAVSNLVISETTPAMMPAKS